MTDPPDHLWIVGPGRMGLALGGLLHQARAVASLTYLGRRPAPPPHALFEGDSPPARYLPDLLALASLHPDPTGVLLAVPDAAVEEVAARLAESELPPGIPVLHLSGTLELEVLAPLARVGYSVGVLHPLAAVADPVEGAQRLRGAWFGIEGEGAALALAERIVHAAEGHALRLQPSMRPLYHAAAVFASNYLVALLGVAERLMARAGVSQAEARAALTQLAAGALAGVAERGPAAALTGPIARGDAGTVRLHLARLSGDERLLYSVLAGETLSLARESREGGVDPALAHIEELLEEKP
ncbi:MAG TPA: Rossmann-like and DUF2520 domain-containing protein [Longimicrobiaceae bacterium]|nr:Rossmann-like and DUF2520 domain-containing protein [Longimicrobiaceae bacterium]